MCCGCCAALLRLRWLVLRRDPLHESDGTRLSRFYNDEAAWHATRSANAPSS